MMNTKSYEFDTAPTFHLVKLNNTPLVPKWSMELYNKDFMSLLIHNMLLTSILWSYMFICCVVVPCVLVTNAR